MFRLRWSRPHLLEILYQVTARVVWAANPLIRRAGYGRVARVVKGPEELAKQVLFGCKMCGQCVLHSTGMTCPMGCPKNLRNGPCGGVRADGHCEVYPELPCVWVQAYARAQEMPIYGHEMARIQPPVDRRLEGTSAWINMLTGADRNTPPGWVPLDEVS
ncbi:MAG: methylenetetrahydrofolate reductase C-terminal domain-containing protein [Caldilineaceae bacterium]|nr:methylenetetrahydrofolate reductase C-terminal domain-containing protein [Caldilineaceae bacterium]